MLAEIQNCLTGNTVTDLQAFNTAFAGLCYTTSCVQCNLPQDFKHGCVKQAVAIAQLLKDKSSSLFSSEAQTAIEVAISSALSAGGSQNDCLEYLIQQS